MAERGEQVDGDLWRPDNGRFTLLSTLQKYTQAEFRRELAFSRAISGDRQYVQDRLRLCAPEILWLLRRPKSHLYICGLKGLEEGVDEALIDITRTHGINWLAFKSEMHMAGRYHVEVC